MRVSILVVLGLVFTIHTTGAAQPLTIIPDPFDALVSDTLTLSNDTADIVQIDSLSLAGADANSFTSIAAFYSAPGPDGPTSGLWGCRTDVGFTGPRPPCLPFQFELAPGERIRLRDFRAGCAICRPAGAFSPGAGDTLLVYTNGASRPRSVALRSVPVVSSETIPGASRLAVAVSPNPAQGRVTIMVRASGIARVAVFDVLGREVALVLNGPVADERRVDLDTSYWPAGTYVVRVSVEGESATARLAVVR